MSACPNQPREGVATDIRQDMSIPPDFVCSISLEYAVNPVRLEQTGQIYDHASFHSWLTAGGSICPLTGVRLKNPIVLVPQRSLRRRIWTHMSSMAAEQGAEPLQRQASPADSPPRAELLAVSLPQRASSGSKEAALDECALQRMLAASRLPGNCPTQQQQLVQEQQEASQPPPDGPQRGLLTSLARLCRAPRTRKPKPSTYFVARDGTHVYRRGDL